MSNHLRLSTHTLTFQACVFILMLFLESPPLLSLHVEFLLIFWASARSPPTFSWEPPQNELLSAPCCEGLCNLLAAPWCSHFLFYSSSYTFISHEESADCSRSQVLFWYFQVLCNSGGSVSSLLNQRWEAWLLKLLLKLMHHTWPLMLKQISLSVGRAETGKVLLA